MNEINEMNEMKTGKLKNSTLLLCFQLSIFRDKQVFLSHLDCLLCISYPVSNNQLI